MRILYVVHANSWDEYSGTPLIAEQYARESINKGCEACIITPTFNNFDFENQKPKKKNNIFYLKWPGLKNWSVEAFNEVKSSKNQIIKIPFKPDIIHILDWVNIDPSILKALKKFNVPIIKHVFNFEDFCYFISPIYKEKDNSYCNAPLSADDCANCISKNKFENQKILRKVKNIFFNEKKKLKNLLKEKLLSRNKIVVNQIKNYYDHLVFPSKSFADYYFSHVDTIKKNSIIPHGIDTNFKNIEKKNSSTLKFIYTGGVSIRKGWKVIEDVFYKICSEKKNKIELRIYGDKNKTKKSKLKKFSNIKFFDSFNPKEINNVMQWADVGIAPSFFETYSRIVREYINYNIVPISTNAFGVSDIIKNNHNGIIINEPYSENLFLIIKQILNDPKILNDLRSEMSSTKIVSTEKEFNEIFNLYKNLSN